MAKSKDHTSLEKLKSILSYFANLDSQHVCARSGLGPQLNFQGWLDDVNAVKTASERLQSILSEDLPSFVINLLLGKAIPIHGLLKEMEKFSVTEKAATADDRYGKLTDQLRSHFSRYAAEFWTSLPLAQSYSTSRGFADTLSAAKADIEMVKDAADGKFEELEKLVSAAAEIAGKQAVGAHAKIFKETSDEHLKKATKWFCGMIGVGVGSFTLTILLFVWNPFAGTSPGSGPPQLSETGIDIAQIQATIARVICVSISYFFLIWCNSNYRAQRHLSVVNKHRSDALLTFEIFAAQASDEVKQQVVLEATRCIFGPSVSGYLGPGENTQSPIAEIVRPFLPSKVG